MLNIHEAQRLARRPPFDIGLICVKSFDTTWAATLAAQFIGDDGYLVSAQNCWNDPALAEVVGAERAIGLVMSSIQVALYEPASLLGAANNDAATPATTCFVPVSTMDGSPGACAS